MKGWRLGAFLIFAIAVSFAGGFVVHYILTFDPHSGEPHQTELEKLRQEACGFFYDTMRELFVLDYGPQDGHVSQSALATFRAHRSELEPRCWLINVYPDYGTFYGQALFPSGDIFEVGMGKTDQGWELQYFHHLGTEHYYHDLQGSEGVMP